MPLASLRFALIWSYGRPNIFSLHVFFFFSSPLLSLRSPFSSYLGNTRRMHVICFRDLRFNSVIFSLPSCIAFPSSLQPPSFLFTQFVLATGIIAEVYNRDQVENGKILFHTLSTLLRNLTTAVLTIGNSMRRLEISQSLRLTERSKID